MTKQYTPREFAKILAWGLLFATIFISWGLLIGVQI